MLWIFAIILLLAILSESAVGKGVIIFSVIAIGSLLIEWITEITIFFTIAKICAVIIVVLIVVGIISFLSE